MAVLVDEYDKPILEVLDEPEVARANRDFLHAVYGAVKFAGADIRFSFFTGVSKFTKVSLLSDLNNLTGITLRPAYSSICGYTDADLDTVFSPELTGLDLDAVTGGEELLDRFDVGDIGTEALLFQTGYLTITGEEEHDDGPTYRLGYPNRELRQSLNRSLLRTLAPGAAEQTRERLRLRGTAGGGRLRGNGGVVPVSVERIPFEWHTRNEIARYEGYYASVFYACFLALGVEAAVEDSSNRGRMDLAVRAYGQVFLFEFKTVEREAEGRALAQLRQRGYAEKYRRLGAPIHLVGVEFSGAQRNLVGFAVERA